MTTPTPEPADLDGIATGFIDVDGIDVHVARVPQQPHTRHPDDATTNRDEPGGHDRVGVVLLHHFWGNVATWRRVLRGLDDRDIPAVAVDRPGFGWSQRPNPARARSHDPNPYTRAFTVDAARRAVADAGFDEVVVVGSSMGGALAIELADMLTNGAHTNAREPPRAPRPAHLVLLSPALASDVGVPAPLRALLRGERVNRIMRPVVERFSRGMDLDRVAGGWHDRSLADESDVTAYAEPMQLPGWAHGVWQLLTVESPPSLHRTAAGLDVPTTVVSGRHDRTIRPRWNRRTARTMDARLVEVDAGHTPQEEAPHLVVDLVADVVATIRGSDDRRRDSDPAAR